MNESKTIMGLTIHDLRDNNAKWLLNRLQEMSAEDALQTISDLYDELHKPQYPKTYEECCKVFKIEYPYFKTEEDGISASTYKNKLFGALKQLLICRDAYWKTTAGEWEPDWLDTNTQKYCIYYVGDEIKKQPMLEVHHFLAFPTAEMRDVFYENFKDLIQQCKELL